MNKLLQCLRSKPDAAGPEDVVVDCGSRFIKVVVRGHYGGGVFAQNEIQVTLPEGTRLFRFQHDQENQVREFVLQTGFRKVRVVSESGAPIFTESQETVSRLEYFENYLLRKKEKDAILVDIGASVRIYHLQASLSLVHTISIGSGTLDGIFAILGQDYFNQSPADPQNVDLTVGDIYGRDYSLQNLPSSMVAGYLAKTQDFGDLLPEVCASMLRMLAVNTVRTANKVCQVRRARKIIFSGGVVESSQFRGFLEEAIQKFVKVDHEVVVYPVG